MNVLHQAQIRPLEDRVRSIIVDREPGAEHHDRREDQSRRRLCRSPYVELAIQIARGSADFLKKDLADALKDLKDEKLSAAFAALESQGGHGVDRLRRTGWKRRKLPKATAELAIGEEKYQRFLAETELVDLPPAKILEIGLAELKHEQEVFAEAAQIIDPSKPPAEVFKEIQKEHPDAREPDSRHQRKTWMRSGNSSSIDKLVTIPSKVRAQVKETPQFGARLASPRWTHPGRSRRRRRKPITTSRRPRTIGPSSRRNEWLTAFNYLHDRRRLDSRGLSRALRAVPPPERLQGYEAGEDFRQLRLRRRLGALHREDDDR